MISIEISALSTRKKQVKSQNYIQFHLLDIRTICQKITIFAFEKMKKIISILLILIYALSVPGVTMASHYCMGMWVATNMGYDNQDDECSLCKIEKHTDQQQKDCCHDDYQFVKTTSDQDVVVTHISIQAPVFTLDNVDFIESATADAFTSFPQISRAVPPDIPIFKQVQNYRI